MSGDRVAWRLLPADSLDAPTTVLPVFPQEAPRVARRTVARLIVTRHPWLVGFNVGATLFAVEVFCTPFVR